MMLNQSEKNNIIIDQLEFNNFIILNIPFNSFNYQNILQYEKKTLDILDSSGGHIILNMAHVESIDSKALAFIVNLHKLCLKAGGHFGLLSTQPPVMELMELSKFTDILEFYNNLDEIAPHLGNTA